MRIAICSLIAAFAVITTAQAQPNVTPIGLGPYNFGMTLAEVQATSPQAGWQIEEASGGGQILTGGPRIERAI